MWKREIFVKKYEINLKYIYESWKDFHQMCRSRSKNKTEDKRKTLRISYHHYILYYFIEWGLTSKWNQRVIAELFF